MILASLLGEYCVDVSSSVIPILVHRFPLASCLIYLYTLIEYINRFAVDRITSTRQHSSYGDCLEVKREYYQNCSVLGCVTQCSRSAAHSYEQFLQVQQIGFVTLGPLRHE